MLTTSLIRMYLILSPWSFSFRPIHCTFIQPYDTTGLANPICLWNVIETDHVEPIAIVYSDRKSLYFIVFPNNPSQKIKIK
jgi:hypothetical protein